MEHSIAIVVLSYRRQDYLRRQLLYYADKPVHLLIADGSDQAWELGNWGSSGKMSWEYIHMAGLDTYMERMRIAVARVTAQFMCFLDDEECLLWTGIDSAINHLLTHPDQSCAGGRVAVTRSTKEGLALIPWGTPSDPCRWSSPWSLMSDDPVQRFAEMCVKGRTANLYYQLFRTSDIKKYVSCIRDDGFVSINSPEIALTGFISLSGKWEMGAYPFWIRNGESVAGNYEQMDMSLTMRDTQHVTQILMEALSNPRTWAPEFDADMQEEIARKIENRINEQWGRQEKPSPSTAYVRGALLALRIVRSRMRVRSRFRWVQNRLGRKFGRTSGNSYEDVSTRVCLGPLTFADYALTYGDASPKVQADLTYLEQIWTTYPSGCPEGNFSSLT